MGRKGDFSMIEMVIALAVVGATGASLGFLCWGRHDFAPAFYYAFTTLGADRI